MALPSWIDAKLFNVLHMGVAFLLVFSAFNSAGFVQEIVIDSYSNATGGDIDPHAGYYSLAVIYAVFTVANLFAPAIIALTGPKWAMVGGALCYVCFVAAFLVLREWLLYAASAVNGFGAAILWTGQGNYLTLNSNEETIGRNSGITWALLQSGLLVGGTMLYVLFSEHTSKILQQATIELMYAVFAVVMLVGCALLALLRPAPKPADAAPMLPPVSPEPSAAHDNYVESYSRGNPEVVDAVGASGDLRHGDDSPPPAGGKLQEWIGSLVGTFRLLFTPHMLLLCAPFCFTGLEQSFWTSIYPTSLGFTMRFPTKGNTLVAYHSLCVAAGEIVGGGAFVLMGDRFNRCGRNPVVLAAFALHAATYYVVFLNLPAQAPLRHTDAKAYIEPSFALALVCSFALGLADACWNTQIYSLLGSFYADTSAEAFALFKCMQSATACASMYYGAALELQWQLAILCLAAALSALCFFPVEFAAQRRRPPALKLA